MRVGLASSVLGLIFMLAGCFAVSTDHGPIKNACFGKGTLKNEGVLMADIYVGLKSLASTAADGTEGVVSFDELCDSSLPIVQANKAKCDDCHENSFGMVTTVILGTITCLPTIFTDVLRMYPAYDVNCQKTWAVIFALFSTISTLAAFSMYKGLCQDSFPSGDFTDENGTAFNLTWSTGPGLVLCVVATLLKFVDIIVHLLVPVPEICRNEEMQREYEEYSGNTRGGGGGGDGGD